jgi:hypothetical protein
MGREEGRVMIECAVCGGRVVERSCDGCARILSTAELMRALPPTNPSVVRLEADKLDFAIREV